MFETCFENATLEIVHENVQLIYLMSIKLKTGYIELIVVINLCALFSDVSYNFTVEI